MLDTFYTDAEELIVHFDAFVQKHDLSLRTLPDHICYKCGSRESFERVRTFLEHESDYIHQSIISGRPIAYIKLKKPFATVLGDIYFLELSDQKHDGSQKEGFEHIEVYPLSITYNEFVDELREKENVIKVERPHHTTHDIEIGKGHLFRCTTEPLLQKIIREEMGI